ncbi:MAG: c-type cytochrome [Cyclobacteriaceae bacterium]|nr:c-type cytochrome [Cyclobacteriaceae bacterium]
MLLYVIVGLVLLISVLVLLVAIYTLYVVRAILKQEQTVSGESKVEEPGETIWMKVSKSLTRAKPIEEEEDILLDHNYDGIKELDNHLPPWWKWLFYITIVWSLIYLLAFHVFDWMPLSSEEYNISIARAEAAMEAQKASSPSAAIDENNVTVATEEAALAQGETIFIRQCAVCHQQDGGGNVGPNLTDDYWIHGGSIKDIFSIIKYGVPQKGMISWESQLNPTEMRDVASYIKVKLVGTEPANPKEPQGELYDPSTEEEENIESDTTEAATDIVAQILKHGGSLSN